MIGVVLLGGGFFLFIIVAIIAFLLYRNRQSTSKIVTTADGGISATASTLKEEIPAVLATVKGEKAKDVVASGYFASVYPGVKIVTKPTALPTDSAAFQLLTDTTGTITGVQANSVLWNGGN